jgi:hypothetical protein
MSLVARKPGRNPRSTLNEERRIDAMAQSDEAARAAEDEARLRGHAPTGLWFGDLPGDELPW